MKNKIEDLRDHLFETIEALKDEDNPMDLARARTISDVAKTVIESAKVENEFMRITETQGSGFIPAEKRQALPPPKFVHNRSAAALLNHPTRRK